MPDPDEPSPLKGLGERIAARRDERAREQARKSSLASTSGLGLGLRIATELVSALAVGVTIGLILDNWLNTAPWLLITFFILGAAAAMTNLIRTAKEADAAQARERAEAEAAGSQQAGDGAARRETDTRADRGGPDGSQGSRTDSTRQGHGGNEREG
jgi:ATP synthase protein I